MHLDTYALSHIGNRRNNEDAWHINSAYGLYLIADGVGGHAAGEIASELACHVVNKQVIAGKSLTEAIESAHQEICKTGTKHNTKAMASTIVALQIKEQAATLAWIGDSRGYLYNGQLISLTRDHTVVEGLLDAGLLTQNEAHAHPNKHILSQALGSTSTTLQVDSCGFELSPESVVLLCTDGLTDVVSEPEIQPLLARNDSAKQLCDALINRALSNNAQDNCTTLIVRAP